MAVEVGDKAPDFELKDQSGQPVRLSDFHGKKAVVIVFYPFTFTGTCHAELCAIRDDIHAFQNDDVETVAISCDTPFSHRAWAEQEGYDFPILADFWPHGEVAQAYGVFNDQLGCALRGTFIVNKDGEVVYKVVNGLPDARNQDEYRETLVKIGALAA